MLKPRILVPALGTAVLLTVAAAGVPCRAAEFGLSATIRAGLWNAGDWELGIGPLGNNTANTLNLSPANYYPDNLPNRFEIGYTSATNSAFVRYYYGAASYQQVAYAAGGAGLGAGSVWTIPAGALFVSAARRPNVQTAVWIDQLSLGGGVQVLQPFSSTTLLALQYNSSMTTPTTSPVSFRTGASGDWLLSGRIGFLGLSAYNPGGAQRSQLQMIANISGVSAPVPEPAVQLMVGAGLVGLAMLGVRKRRRRGMPK
ncbi:MAG: hypothetical protein HXY18_07855 [Bryobacteraceae bacterium]|nr:hypothetical protein [Bryobacteraceae bacterium]